MTQTKRIEYIDLAKGICIILVVAFHISAFYHVPFPASSFFRAFRMPLYFFLSGFFFKTYGGFLSFIRKKTNKLLVPFVFFYLTLSVFLSIFLYREFGIVLEYAVNFDFWPALTEFITRENFPNSPIWFLLCLFEINILFYICYTIADYCPEFKLGLLLCLTFLIGVSGLGLSWFKMNLPMFIDSSMTSLPFFMMGYVIKNHTSILQQSRMDKYSLLIIIVCFVLVFLLAGKGVSYKTNQFRGIAYLTIYICGFLGTMGIILTAKKLIKLPLVSYWGRYSIMILVTHRVVYQIYAPLIKAIYEKVDFGTVVVNLVLTMMTYLLLIPFMQRFLPHVTAQRDIF